MKILIATGIYPPEVGGPAQYAQNLQKTWINDGHKVKVSIFSRWNFLPTGIRHIAYFLSLLPHLSGTDFVLALDTFSCALPATLASNLFGKKIIIRTGGDFLWESYVERTGDMVLLRNFYETRMSKFSFKEKFVFKITSFVLKNASAIVWSTEWQKEIFRKPYKLENQKNFIIENFYGPKTVSDTPRIKNFIGYTRNLNWKNIEYLKKVFNRKDIIEAGAVLDVSSENLPIHDQFLEAVRKSYAVIVTSLGDISPNTILDAISFEKPFILTSENGLYPRIKDIGLFVDPQNENEIAEKILWLCDEANYQEQKRKFATFNFTHSWQEIGSKFLEVYKNL
jgi:glycosyltransferase involved in cell wall biosynthesis